MNWHTLAYLLVTLLVASGLSILIAWVVLRHQQRRNLVALHYLLDRLSVLQLEKQQLEDELYLLKALLENRGILDEEELTRLRKDLIEIPRQRWAENQQLFEGLNDEDLIKSFINNFPDTLQ